MILTSKELSLGQLWRDAGCARGLGGIRQCLALTRVYRQYNLSPVFDRFNDTIQFGNGQTDLATVTTKYPVFVKCTHRGSISQAVATYICPMLFEQRCAGRWGYRLEDRPDMDLPMHEVGVTLTFAEDKVLVIDIPDIDMTHLRTAWHRLPQWYTLS